MADYTFVPALERASANDYVNLFNASYGGDEKLSARYLDWQYIANPDGRVIGFDAFLGDELAAHYAIIPRRYCLGAQTFEAALSVNTATHPKHQGKGLFSKLADATYQAAAGRGIKFVVGVANAQSVGGFTRKLGFTSLGQVRLCVGFKAAWRADEALDLRIDANWLDWRLANPSRRYARIQHGDGSSTLRTHLKRMPFHIARVDTEVLKKGRWVGSLPVTSGVTPGLVPVFASPPPSMPRLPLKVQPSPWHVIWRALDPICDSSLARHLRLDGLSMDTF